MAAHPGPSAGPFHWENRPLALGELLRLQTFPLSWEVLGTYHKQVRQVGNATPPLLAEVIGREIGSQVFGLKYKGRPKLVIPRRRTIPPRTRPRPVPPDFLHLEGDYEAHPGVGKGPGALLSAA